MRDGHVLVLSEKSLYVLLENAPTRGLADFCGSVLDGSTALISTATRYTRPVPLADRSLNPTEKDDIFALGTVLYEISAEAYKGRVLSTVRRTNLTRIRETPLDHREARPAWKDSGWMLKLGRFLM
jgi:hypothetical protein